MLTDEYVKSKINEGYSKDIEVSPHLFQRCSYCMQSWGPNLQPILYNCGHLMCQQCMNQIKRCCFPGCSNTSPTPKNSKVNLNVQNDIIKPTTILKFFINFKHTQKIQIKEVIASTKVSDLLKGYLQQSYIKKHGGESKCMIRVKSKMVDYNEIKEKKFIDLQHILKITTARQLSNPITIGMFDRFAGGN